MPYYISDQTDCPEWALVKDDGEVIACHDNKESAIAQMVAISLEEGIEPGGEYEGDEMRVRLAKDKFSTKEEAISRAKKIGCAGFHTMTEDGETIYMPCSSHKAYDNIVGSGGYRQESEPAPPEDQIEGSKKNPKDSAKGPGGDIKLSDSTETALRNKVKDHNEKMREDNRPDWTRTTYGQLAAVYRRGSGAYSTSHRPGVSRAAWSMARVNAYLYLLRNGKPENSKYITDYDLLPKDHPKSTRSAEGQDTETREVNLTPPSYMRAAARQGLKYYEEGLAGDGLTDATVREARAMASGNVSRGKWVRLAAWIARHMEDLDAPAANPQNEDYPSPGVVAHLLWGSGPSKRAAQRTMEYAERVVAKLEEENRTLISVEAKDMAKIETRTNATEFEVREGEDGNGMTFTGYAAVFDSPSQPLPFTERIQRGAFRRSLAARNDIKMLWNHESGSILGSTRAGTLRLEEDSYGLRVTADLPDTQLGRDTAYLLKRSDVQAMSFGFSVPKGGDEWVAADERLLKSVRLFEVSIVGAPAYEATTGTTMVRGLDKIAERALVDSDALADAMLKIESGADLTDDEVVIINKVVDELSPQSEETEQDTNDEAVNDSVSPEMLALKKKKLEQLLKRI